MFAKVLKAFRLAGPLAFGDHISVTADYHLEISNLCPQSLDFTVVGYETIYGERQWVRTKYAGCITTEYKDHIQLDPCHLTSPFMDGDKYDPERVAAAWGIPYRYEDLPEHHTKRRHSMDDTRIITLLELFADGLNDKNCHALVFHKSALHPDPDDPDDEEATFEDFIREVVTSYIPHQLEG